MADKTGAPRHGALPNGSWGQTGSLAASSRPQKRPLDNLPLELSSFVGREHEVAEAERMLAGGRLVTLCGPGGCGKTRLALAVARDLRGGYEDGVWWVELASLSDPTLVPWAVASALEVREVPDLSPTQGLVEHLKTREALLILDNCEHLVEACAVLADAALRACPGLRVLATSREPLRTAGERTLTVPSLSHPDPRRSPPAAELARYEAVRLFIERAASVASGFELTERNAPAVARLCRQLDGIPLAIELAAARTRVLTVEQVSAKLEDALGLLTTGSRAVAPRHQTLRAALGWSYDLLGEAERELFERLSAFAGGWGLEAAEAVGAGGSVEEGWVLDLLSALVDKSLVVAEEDAAGYSRYRMLETVRQYASGRLDARGEGQAVRRRHAAYFLCLTLQAEPELSGMHQTLWLDRLEGDLDNLRAALRWFRENGRVLDRLQMAGSLWRFCYLRGHYEEGRGWLEGALAGGHDAPLPARATAHLGAGTLTFLQCDYENARIHLEEALALYRTLGDDRGVASVSQMLGSIARERGEYARSEALHAESLAIWRKLGDEAGEARSLNYLAYAAWLQEKHGWARDLCEETLRRFRGLGDNEIVAWALISLGSASLYAGDRLRARSLLEESLALSKGVGYREGVAWSLNQLGVLAHLEGDGERATGMLRESLSIHNDLGDRWRTASVLDALSRTASDAGRPGSAACLIGAAEAVRDAISVPVPLCERADRENVIIAARANLGDAAYEAAVSAGRRMHPEQAVEHALDQPFPEPPPAEPAAPAEAGPARDRAETPPARLHIYALGVARVEKDGRALGPSSDWIQKPRELLFYLLSHPEGRTKEQIGLALWPDASTSQLRSSFHDTVYRLRRALGAKGWVVFEKRRYAFGRAFSYHYDVEAFEENLAEAHRVRSESSDRTIRHLQEATDLYRGDFLEDFTEVDWAMGKRKELRRRFGEALLVLGGLLLDRSRYAEAADAYRKAIAYDKFLEVAHRGFMRSQAAMGERERSLGHYEDLVKLLDEHLGISPSRETTALYEVLRLGE